MTTSISLRLDQHARLRVPPWSFLIPLSLWRISSARQTNSWSQDFWIWSVVWKILIRCLINWRQFNNKEVLPFSFLTSFFCLLFPSSMASSCCLLHLACESLRSCILSSLLWLALPMSLANSSCFSRNCFSWAFLEETMTCSFTEAKSFSHWILSCLCLAVSILISAPCWVLIVSRAAWCAAFVSSRYACHCLL